MKHNPQNFTPEQFGGPDGFRLLSVEEAAVLTDRLSAKTPTGRALMDKLKPQHYWESACRWCDPIANTITLQETFTWRTSAPELEAIPTIEPGFDPDTLQAASFDFVESWNYLAAYHHQLMVGKGFWKGETDVLATLTAAGREDLVAVALAAFDGQKIALQTSEASEALEGLRVGNGPDDKVPEFLSSEAEFADVLLRLMDHAHKRGWKVGEALIAKMHMNATRAAMHGKSF
jgi:NTP pyrophosphatase (non-canonical NTP hydrolase)